jgi:opacity protein-like surface antigen
VEIKSNAWELVAVGSYPIGTSGFSPYAKAGLYRGETKVSAPLASSKETNTDLTFGIGIRYDFLRNFAVRAEWQRYNGVDAGTTGGVSIGDSAADVISIGALYKF